jgi:hypothetical protein
MDEGNDGQVVQLLELLERLHPPSASASETKALHTSFRQRHSCSHCQAEIIDIARSQNERDRLSPLGGLLHGLSKRLLDAARASTDGCTFYKWLLTVFAQCRTLYRHRFEFREIEDAEFSLNTPPGDITCVLATIRVRLDGDWKDLASTTERLGLARLLACNFGGTLNKINAPCAC